MRILLYLLIGFSVGGVSGLLGIGGGVLLLPLLVWLWGPEQQPRAAGTTLVALILPITLPAAWKYYTQGLIKAEDIRAALCIAAAFALGAYLGASTVTLVPVALLRFGFGLLLVYVAVRFLLASDSEAASAAVGLGSVAAAWLGHHGLRWLGRKYPPPPDLGEAIRTARDERRGFTDYSI